MHNQQPDRPEIVLQKSTKPLKNRISLNDMVESFAQNSECVFSHKIDTDQSSVPQNLYDQIRDSMHHSESSKSSENSETRIQDNSLYGKKELVSFSQFPTAKGFKTSKIQTQDQLQPISQPSEVADNIPSVPRSNKIIVSSHLISDKQIAVKHEGDSTAYQLISKPDIQISEVFQFKGGDTIQLLQIFIKFSEQGNFVVNKIDDTKMVVKSKHEYNSGKQSVLGQLRNALNFCLPFKKDSEMEAYQLKTYLSNPKKAKLIFISGSIESFDRFKQQFLICLWKNHKLKCTSKQEVDFFFHSKIHVIDPLLSKISTVQEVAAKNKMNKLQGQFTIETHKQKEISNIFDESKAKQSQLKVLMAQERGMGPSTERILISKFYQTLNLRSLVVCYISKSRLELFETKKNKIKENQSIREIFHRLQLKDLYKYFESNSKIEFNKSYIEQPFLKSISTLQSLKISANCSPYQCLQIVSKYLIELYKSYNRYYKNSVKGCEDIEEYQLGIYCLIMCENTEIWETVRLLRQFGADEMMGYTKQMTCLQNLEKGIFFINSQWN